MPSTTEGRGLRARVEALQGELRDQTRAREGADSRAAKVERELATVKKQLTGLRDEARIRVERRAQVDDDARRLGELHTELAAAQSELASLRVAQAPVERARAGELRVHELGGGLFTSNEKLLSSACTYADRLAPGQLLSVDHRPGQVLLWHFGRPAQGALGEWCLRYHSLVVRAFGMRWKTAVAEAVEFAGHVRPSDLVCISQHRDEDGGSLIVWYWRRR